MTIKTSRGMEKYAYIIYYHTESGDRGLIGPWHKKPTKKQVIKILTDYLPEDYPDYVSWEIKKMDIHGNCLEGTDSAAL
jgi:hypothetical protein